MTLRYKEFRDATIMRDIERTEDPEEEDNEIDEEETDEDGDEEKYINLLKGGTNKI